MGFEWARTICFHSSVPYIPILICVCMARCLCIYYKVNAIVIYSNIVVVFVARWCCVSYSVSLVALPQCTAYKFLFRSTKAIRRDEMKRKNKSRAYIIILIRTVFRWMINVFGLIAYREYTSIIAMRICTGVCVCVFIAVGTFNWISVRNILSVCVCFLFSLNRTKIK